jgi:hypothetical protein
VCILAFNTYSEKAREGSLGYSISKYGFWINWEAGLFGELFRVIFAYTSVDIKF